MRYCGVDLSTRAIDLAFLDADQNHAEWVRIHLEGDTAWDRILTIREQMPPTELWDAVGLVAVEKPMPDQRGLLGNVLGALSASLPKQLRQGHTFWTCTPTVWKKGIGLHGTRKPTLDEVLAVVEDQEQEFTVTNATDYAGADDLQHFVDALGVAAWARMTNEGGQQ